MKYALCSILPLAILPLFLEAQESGSNATSWNDVAHAWSTYIQDPTAANGEALFSLLPDHKNPPTHYDSASYFSIYHHLGSLEKLVVQQDRLAVRIAFRMLNICDASFCETLDQILGKLIQRNPTMFLEELYVHADKGHFGLGGLLCNLGDQFVDRTQESNAEFRLRIAALQKVKVDTLTPIRDLCISRLKSCIR